MNVTVFSTSKDKNIISNVQYIEFLDLYAEPKRVLPENFQAIKLNDMRGDLTVFGDSIFTIRSENIESVHFSKD